MLHQRHVIREAIAARLRAANTAAAQRVYEHPTDPQQGFPALIVEDVSEQQAMPTMPGSANRLVERVLIVDVTAVVQQSALVARERDQLLADVEVAFMAEPFPGVRNVELQGYMPDTAAGAQPIASGRQRFALTYLTAANNPAVCV